MIALFRGLSLTWRLVVIGAVLASITTAYITWRNSIFNAGVAKEKARVEKANKEAVNRAHQALARRRACSASGGVWNQSTGECDRGL